MDQCAPLVQKYAILGYDPNIIRQTFYATPQV